MSLGFQTALSALTTAQRALQVIGNNIANAATPGYSRQRVELSSLASTSNDNRLFFGRGVDITKISRIADALLDGRIRAQQSEVGRQSLIRDHLLEVETVFGEPGPNGTGAALASLFASLSAMTGAPEDPALRHGVVQSGLSAADTLRLARRQLGDIQGSFDEAVATEIQRINGLTSEITLINEQIVASRQGSEIPAALLDRQEQLLRELADHIDIQATRDATGRVTVVGGSSALVSPRGQVPLEIVNTGSNGPGFAVRGVGSNANFVARSGKLKALQDLAATGIVDKIAKLDTLAKNLILEFNRVHSTGIPASGGYTDLSSTNLFRDINNSGNVLDDLLQDSGLPFAMAKGDLQVNVTDDATGIVRRTTIAIDPSTMTVQDLKDALDAVPDLTAVVDPSGRLRVLSASGHRFDFSNRVLPKENLGKTFGSDAATITGGIPGPYFLGAGQSFSLSVDGGAAQTVSFAPGQFGNIFQATPAEVAASINSQVTGATADVVDGRVVLRSNSTGTASTLQLTDGTGAPLATLGLSTAAERGDDHAVTVSASGVYTGSVTRDLVVRPLSSGTIGTTPGLKVEVRDPATNALVATLDVGAGYEPGTELDLTDGVRIAFGPGTVSTTGGDRFEMKLIAKSDSADVLAATGLGAFFTGSDAATIGLAEGIERSPALIAASLTGAAGDNGNALRLLAIRDASLSELGGTGISGFYQNFIAELGGESGRSASTLESQDLVLQSLEARRDSISGVNIDEELANMQQFQNSYEVAARFLQTMQEVTNVLLNMLG